MPSDQEHGHSMKDKYLKQCPVLNECQILVAINIFYYRKLSEFKIGKCLLYLDSVSEFGLPWSLSGKEYVCYAGDESSIPGSGRTCEEENGNPLQSSCLENHLDRRAWQATVHGVTTSLT